MCRREIRYCSRCPSFRVRCDRIGFSPNNSIRWDTVLCHSSAGRPSESRGFQKLGIQNVQEHIMVDREQPFPTVPVGPQRLAQSSCPKGFQYGQAPPTHHIRWNSAVYFTYWGLLTILLTERIHSRQTTRYNTERNTRGLGVPTPNTQGCEFKSRADWRAALPHPRGLPSPGSAPPPRFICSTTMTLKQHQKA